ncbi:MAG: hypothetical protein K2J32_09310 [Ruminococcus sp.]|nr:hypothetical protein [Ruminococcus sp.]
MSLKTKIQIEAIRRLEKKLQVSYDNGKDCIYLTVDGKSAVKIPDDSFFLDKSKLHKSGAIVNSFNITPNELYKLTDTYYRRPYSKGVAVCFENELSQSETDVVYCDEKTLKKLSVEGAKIFTNKSMTRIYLELIGEIYAVILPLNFCEPKENEC